MDQRLSCARAIERLTVAYELQPSLQKIVDVNVIVEPMDQDENINVDCHSISDITDNDESEMISSQNLTSSLPSIRSSSPLSQVSQPQKNMNPLSKNLS